MLGAEPACWEQFVVIFLSVGEKCEVVTDIEDVLMKTCEKWKCGLAYSQEVNDKF